MFFKEHKYKVSVCLCHTRTYQGPKHQIQEKGPTCKTKADAPCLQSVQIIPVPVAVDELWLVLNTLCELGKTLINVRCSTIWLKMSLQRTRNLRIKRKITLLNI